MSGRVIISVATTADGYMDDTFPERLVLSNEADWCTVYGLRASCDAIIVGANTIRRDNPSLTIKSPQARALRLARGQKENIARVVLSCSCNIPSDAKIFSSEGERIIFCPEDINLDATIVKMPVINAKTVVKWLFEHGYRRILVEGGGEMLKMFIEQRAVDYIRHAISPLVAGGKGYSHFALNRKADYIEMLGEMQIEHHYINSSADKQYLMEAIEQSRLCKPQAGNYSVGAVLVTDERIFHGYTHQSAPNNHAEEEVIAQALEAGVSMHGATIYSSIEPCSTRKSKPRSCSQLIIDHGIARVVYALAEPTLFVNCNGTDMLREAGIEVDYIASMGGYVREVNSHLKI